MAETDGPYDVIVVGARCAGSPTAMLLARQGCRVLLLDRDQFPSDTLSTHVLHPRAVAALARWGLLERLQATGCPPLHTYSFDFGAVTLEGSPGGPESPVAFCARRTILDHLLLNAAEDAGAVVWTNACVDHLLIEDGRVCGVVGRSVTGRKITERAPLVIGADGRNSLVAETVEAERYKTAPPQIAFYYGYWSGLPMNGRFELYDRVDRIVGAAPTHHDQTLVVVGLPAAALKAGDRDVEVRFLEAVDRAPEFAARLRAARRETRFVGGVTPNWFRKPFGPGWALVGDAGYIRDPVTAQGISDAFRDAELCATAAQAVLCGASADRAMAGYQAARDRAAAPMYAYTLQLARLEPPPPELQELVGAIAGDRKGMDDFARTYAGTLSPDDFFAPSNVEALVGAAHRRAEAPGGASATPLSRPA